MRTCVRASPSDANPKVPRTMIAKYSLVDLFAGCGGMTLGFEQTGRFRSGFAVEWEQAAAKTYRRNFGDHVFAGAIEEVEEFPPCDVLIGGPPCQGFSPLNMQRVGLERRAWWRQYLRALEEEAPAAFVMENVPELLRSAEYQAFADQARDGLRRRGAGPQRGRPRRPAASPPRDRRRVAARHVRVAGGVSLTAGCDSAGRAAVAHLSRCRH